MSVLGELEQRPGPSTPPKTDTLRVAAWNAERGGHVEGGADLLRRCGADVCLLTELDVGMARSGNQHTASQMAQRLGHGYVFGVEFFELGLGNRRERERLGLDVVNDVGLHGNAVTSSMPIGRATLVRIEAGGSWYRPESSEPRVGGRMAVVGVVPLGNDELIVGAVHLESESDPDGRAAQLAVVLDALDECYGRGPAVVGGDLNTFSAGRDQLRRPAAFDELTAADAERWSWPVPHEPLFAVAAAHGFTIAGANLAEPTIRVAGAIQPVSLLRLDWLLVRGVTASEPATIAAVDNNGQILSDHDAVAVTVTLT